MKTLTKLFVFVCLTTAGVRGIQAAETNLVQDLHFHLTAWYQGPTVTNDNTVTYHTTNSTVTTRDVVNWLGTATGNDLSNGVLLVVTQLGVSNAESRVIVRVKTPTSTNNVNVSSFFERIANAVTVDHIKYNTTNGAVNGMYVGYWGFVLQNSTNADYQPLPAHFSASGFGVDEVESVVDSAGNVIGVADVGTVANAAGTGDWDETPAVFEGSIEVLGQVVEIDSTPVD